MGRPAKPTALKLIQGNPGKRALNKNEPKPKVVKAPKPPMELCPIGKKEWARVCKEMVALNMITELDTATLAGYCIAFARFKTATVALRELEKKDPLFKGMMIKTTSGNWIQNPLVGVARRAGDDMLSYAKEFGMTPAARSRISVVQKEADDEWGDF